MLGSRERSHMGRGGDKGRKMKRRMTNAHCIQPGRQERKMAGMEKNLVFISRISLKITLTILKHNQDKVIYSDGKIKQ